MEATDVHSAAYGNQYHEPKPHTKKHAETKAATGGNDRQNDREKWPQGYGDERWKDDRVRFSQKHREKTRAKTKSGSE
ncbi:MAG TPA: hypothetical protein VIM69_04260 [Opitutaceae bacterium]